MNLKHVFGTTEIRSEPKRIATLGVASNDTCLALGVIPVAMSLSKAQPNGSTPWFDFSWKKFGVELPLLLDESKGLPTDDLRGLQPDLILAVNSKLTRSEYEDLSKIAPVVAFPDRALATDWRTSLALIGEALGRSSEAARIRTETEKAISAELGSYPDLAGTRFLYAKVSAAPGADFEIFGDASNPVRILREFGLQPAAALSQVAAQGRAVGTSSSGPETYAWPQERAASLDSDIAVFSVVREEATEVKGNGTLREVPAYKANNYVFADSKDSGLALETGSCLSVQWLSRTMVPELARAAYGAKHGA
ncbi:ABC transporter substrate-binding protein [Arthrobacter sp. B3I9]|uniref:ABC transporter substrate-binding protein n=1 Tax=Arthrobacter sp. B3I9 TaxID=3042270 RepID=UPI0027D8BC8A|nr:ABC transporter substrate-binding protein [Arthrobacter sp. B3I9]